MKLYRTPWQTSQGIHFLMQKKLYNLWAMCKKNTVFRICTVSENSYCIRVVDLFGVYVYSVGTKSWPVFNSYLLCTVLQWCKLCVFPTGEGILESIFADLPVIFFTSWLHW